LTKGVHALVPAAGPWRAALTIPQDQVRVSFAVPFYGMLLLGTTDTPDDREPSQVAVEPADVEQVVSEAAVAVDPSLVAGERVRATFAGLRVLPAEARESVSVRRETVISWGSAGMLSVAGGKLSRTSTAPHWLLRMRAHAVSHEQVLNLARREKVTSTQLRIRLALAVATS